MKIVVTLSIMVSMIACALVITVGIRSRKKKYNWRDFNIKVLEAMRENKNKKKDRDDLFSNLIDYDHISIYPSYYGSPSKFRIIFDKIFKRR